MSRRNLTLTDKIAVLEQIKNQPRNTSHHHLAEITGVPKSTIARIIQQQINCEMNGHYMKDNREFSKSGSMKVRIQMLKRPSVSGSVL
jgi:hypothetical protein